MLLTDSVVHNFTSDVYYDDIYQISHAYSEEFESSLGNLNFLLLLHIVHIQINDNGYYLIASNLRFFHG